MEPAGNGCARAGAAARPHLQPARGCYLPREQADKFGGDKAAPVFCPTAEGRLQQYHIKNLEIVHVRGDPRSMVEMRKLVKVENFKAAVVVSDSLWCALLQGLAAVPPAASVLADARTCPAKHWIQALSLTPLPPDPPWQVRHGGGWIRGRPVRAHYESGRLTLPLFGRWVLEGNQCSVKRASSVVGSRCPDLAQPVVSHGSCKSCVAKPLCAVPQADMLALDSACLMVQLNIRLLLEVGPAGSAAGGVWIGSSIMQQRRHPSFKLRCCPCRWAEGAASW